MSAQEVVLVPRHFKKGWTPKLLNSLINQPKKICRYTSPKGLRSTTTAEIWLRQIPPYHRPRAILSPNACIWGWWRSLHLRPAGCVHECMLAWWDSVLFTLPKFSVSLFSWSCCNHLMRLRSDARFFKIWCWSKSWYFPCSRVCLKKELFMTLVRASAICAPLWTHFKVTPSSSKSRMARACNMVRNSWQFGFAVRVTRS